MKKTIAFITSVFIIISMFIVEMPMVVKADSLYIRKIVSVVYDDSGSMKDDNKWSYANYAMQTFSGMLNSEDRLYISYMSEAYKKPDYEPEEIDLSSDRIQQSIESIKIHDGYGQTPYSAVQAAYNKLLTTPDSNPNTQYWLVVLTDGDFNDAIIKNPEQPDELSEFFEEYVSEPMPNGSNAQVTYFAIGDGATRVPSQEDKGIHTFSCAKDSEIIQTMSDIADRISGRTRLDISEITEIDDKTIQFSSSISLLNIAVLAQKTDAKIDSATYSNEVAIPISRKAELSFQEFDGRQYPDLNGSAYLLGDTQNIIGAGTYKIVFDKPVDKDNIVVLVEPALEVRMTVRLDGKELSDLSELSGASEGNKITVSCDLYEMNTDHKIEPSLLPQNTVYNIYVYEGDVETVHRSGTAPELKDYALKNIQTKIKASVQIENFNPIEYTKKFTPKAYVPPDVYTIKGGYVGGVKSVKYDNIAQNKTLKLCFTVSVNGEVISDPKVIRDLNPEITVSPEGNSGEIKIEDDGTITFLPNKAEIVVDDSGHFDVAVTCVIDNGVSRAEASETYTVLVSDYEVIPRGANGSIRKNEFYNNKIGVSFIITKDGKQLEMAQIEKDVAVSLNDEYKNMNINLTIDHDGTIHCVPSSEEQREYNFLSWWSNWWYYFSLPGGDMTVTLSHSYGTADQVIDVIPADIGYIIGWVVAPLLTEIILLVLVVSYIVRYITKPRFASGAAIYIGNLRYDSESGKHTIVSFKRIELKKFNKFRYLWNPFKLLTVGPENSDLTISISALKNNKISCNSSFPWYIADELISKDPRIAGIETPQDIIDVMKASGGRSLKIKQIDSRNVRDKGDRTICMNASKYYCVKAELENAAGQYKQTVRKIMAAKIFCYTRSN